jgi:hypothetical protein
MDHNWPQIELDYRAGVMSINAICSIHSVSRQSLMGHVANNGWTRDLLAQVHAEVNERLYLNRQKEQCENDHVAAAAEVMVGAIRKQRADIENMRGAFNTILARVQEILDCEVTEDGLINKNKVMIRAIEVALLFGKSQGAVGAMDTLASAYQRIMTMERQAYGLDGLAAFAQQQGEPGQLPAATVQIYLPDNHRNPVAA